MTTQTQGGLNQVSQARPANQAKPAPQAGNKFDANAVQAENLEEISKSKPTGLKETVVDDLGDQREAMNSALKRMRDSLDDRKNRLFDPVLMQTAAGFLKPTKTGSFGESLGYAAENAGVAAEREAAFQRENQKLEMELLGKEQELRQQLGGDQLISALMGGPKNNSAPPPAAGAVTTPDGQLRVPGATSPVDVATTTNPQQVLTAARQGRIPITDEILLLANRVAPKLLPTLTEIRKAQEGEEKNRIDRERVNIEREKLGQDKRKVIPRGLRTEREMNAGEYTKYKAALDQFFLDGDEQKLLDFYDRNGYLESEQVSGRKITPKPVDGTSQAGGTLSADGKSPTGGTSSTGGNSSSSTIGRAKTATELEEEKAQRQAERDIDKDIRTQTGKNRAEAAEKMASRLGLQAEAAFENTNIAQDMIGYAKNNPAVFQLMNKPGLANAIARAVEQGASVGNFNVSLPASVVLQYKLGENDLTALQMFMQKNAQLQSRGRQLNRTPGEGSMSDFETKLLGGIYALPSDSQRAIILKSDALIMQGMFDEQRFKLWNQKSKQQGYTYNDFLVDEDFKKLKSDYRKTLERVREENLDLLTPKKKEKPAASPAPDAQAPKAPAADAPAPSNNAPKNETYSQRLKRLQEEKNKKGQ
jgi:hypothetical protein